MTILSASAVGSWPGLVSGDTVTIATTADLNAFLVRAGTVASGVLVRVDANVTTTTVYSTTRANVAFNGTFDGQNYTVTVQALGRPFFTDSLTGVCMNLKLVCTGTATLANCICTTLSSSGQIIDSTVVVSSWTTFTTSTYFAATTNSGTIARSVFRNDSVATTTGACIVSSNTGTINACSIAWSPGTTNTSTQAMVAITNSGTISSCTAANFGAWKLGTSTTDATTVRTGGICGTQTAGSVSACCFVNQSLVYPGTISATQYVRFGGICGYATGGTLTKCCVSNDGHVTTVSAGGTAYSAGILGGGTIAMSACYLTGTGTFRRYPGHEARFGLVTLSSGIATNCYVCMNPSCFTNMSNTYTFVVATTPRNCTWFSESGVILASFDSSGASTTGAMTFDTSVWLPAGGSFPLVRGGMQSLYFPSYASKTSDAILGNCSVSAEVVPVLATFAAHATLDQIDVTLIDSTRSVISITLPGDLSASTSLLLAGSSATQGASRSSWTAGSLSGVAATTVSAQSVSSWKLPYGSIVLASNTADLNAFLVRAELVPVGVVLRLAANVTTTTAYTTSTRAAFAFYGELDGAGYRATLQAPGRPFFTDNLYGTAHDLTLEFTGTTKDAHGLCTTVQPGALVSDVSIEVRAWTAFASNTYSATATNSGVLLRVSARIDTLAPSAGALVSANTGTMISCVSTWAQGTVNSGTQSPLVLTNTGAIDKCIAVNACAWKVVSNTTDTSSRYSAGICTTQTSGMTRGCCFVNVNQISPATIATTQYMRFGGICANATGGGIERCSFVNSGSVTVQSAGGAATSAGILGSGTVPLTKCYVVGSGTFGTRPGQEAYLGMCSMSSGTTTDCYIVADASAWDNTTEPYAFPFATAPRNCSWFSASGSLLASYDGSGSSTTSPMSLSAATWLALGSSYPLVRGGIHAVHLASYGSTSSDAVVGVASCNAERVPITVRYAADETVDTISLATDRQNRCTVNILLTVPLADATTLVSAESSVQTSGSRASWTFGTLSGNNPSIVAAKNVSVWNVDYGTKISISDATDLNALLTRTGIVNTGVVVSLEANVTSTVAYISASRTNNSFNGEFKGNGYTLTMLALGRPFFGDNLYGPAHDFSIVCSGASTGANVLCTTVQPSANITDVSVLVQSWTPVSSGTFLAATTNNGTLLRVACRVDSGLTGGGGSLVSANNRTVSGCTVYWSPGTTRQDSRAMIAISNAAWIESCVAVNAGTWRIPNASTDVTTAYSGAACSTQTFGAVRGCCFLNLGVVAPTGGTNRANYLRFGGCVANATGGIVETSCVINHGSIFLESAGGSASSAGILGSGTCDVRKCYVVGSGSFVALSSQESMLGMISKSSGQCADSYVATDTSSWTNRSNEYAFTLASVPRNCSWFSATGTFIASYDASGASTSSSMTFPDASWLFAGGRPLPRGGRHVVSFPTYSKSSFWDACVGTVSSVLEMVPATTVFSASYSTAIGVALDNPTACALSIQLPGNLPVENSFAGSLTQGSSRASWTAGSVTGSGAPTTTLTSLTDWRYVTYGTVLTMGSVSEFNKLMTRTTNNLCGGVVLRLTADITSTVDYSSPVTQTAQDWYPEFDGRGFGITANKFNTPLFGSSFEGRVHDLALYMTGTIPGPTPVLATTVNVAAAFEDVAVYFSPWASGSAVTDNCTTTNNGVLRRLLLRYDGRHQTSTTTTIVGGLTRTNSTTGTIGDCTYFAGGGPHKNGMHGCMAIANAGVIDSCMAINSGTILVTVGSSDTTTSTKFGGICTSQTDGRIDRCIFLNIGSIVGRNTANSATFGGILGDGVGGVVTRCAFINHGSVILQPGIAATKSGGILGRGTAPVSFCYLLGSGYFRTFPGYESRVFAIAGEAAVDSCYAVGDESFWQNGSDSFLPEIGGAAVTNASTFGTDGAVRSSFDASGTGTTASMTFVGTSWLLCGGTLPLLRSTNHLVAASRWTTLSFADPVVGTVSIETPHVPTFFTLKADATTDVIVTALLDVLGRPYGASARASVNLPGFLSSTTDLVFEGTAASPNGSSRDSWTFGTSDDIIVATTPAASVSTWTYLPYGSIVTISTNADLVSFVEKSTSPSTDGVLVRLLNDVSSTSLYSSGTVYNCADWFGEFDGQGHSMTFDRLKMQMFGTATCWGRVTNVTIAFTDPIAAFPLLTSTLSHGAVVDSIAFRAGGGVSGPINGIANNNNGIVKDVVVRLDGNFATTGNTTLASPLVLTNSGLLYNCVVYASSSSNLYTATGLIACSSSGFVEDCVAMNAGTLSNLSSATDNSNSRCGGICGEQSFGVISRCTFLNIGTVANRTPGTGAATFGGIVGFTNGGMVDKCVFVNHGAVSVQSTGSSFRAAGIAARGTSSLSRCTVTGTGTLACLAGFESFTNWISGESASATHCYVVADASQSLSSGSPYEFALCGASASKFDCSMFRTSGSLVVSFDETGASSTSSMSFPDAYWMYSGGLVPAARRSHHVFANASSTPRDEVFGQVSLSSTLSSVMFLDIVPDASMNVFQGDLVGLPSAPSAAAVSFVCSTAPTATYYVDRGFITPSTSAWTVYVGLPIVISGTVSDASIYGSADGSVDAQVVGGTSPYISVSWDTGSANLSITGLSAGNYVLDVVDADGTTSFKTFAVSQPARLVVNGVVEPVSVLGDRDGAVDVSVSGGVAPFSFDWNDSVVTEDRTALFAGTYNVTVTDAQGATAYRSFVVTEPGIRVIPSPTTVNVVWKPVQSASSYRIVMYDDTGSVVKFLTHTTTFEANLDALADTAYTVRLYVSANLVDYAQTQQVAFATPALLAASFFLDPLKVDNKYDLTSVGTASLQAMAAFVNDLFISGDVITVRTTYSVEGQDTSFVNDGDQVDGRSGTSLLLPFDPTRGSLQKVYLELQDASVILVEYDETRQLVVVEGVSRNVGELFILGNSLVTVAETL